MDHAFSIIFKNYSHTSCPEDFSPAFSFKSLNVLSFMLAPVVHFELVFVLGVTFRLSQFFVYG